MTYREPAPTALGRTRSPVPPAQKLGITMYGCGPDEAALFRQLAPRFGVKPTISAAPLAGASIELAYGNRFISIGHKSRVANATLFALSEAGVQYISTRSTGYDHIDTAYAANVGISVENVEYSPDSVADYTLMLILMAVRGMKSALLRVADHDYRLPDARGKELRELTIGVVGAGRIGQAVIHRLRVFGCRILAYDPHPELAAEYVPLDELLRRSDIVTLHTPLSEDTHHLLHQHRIAQMKRGAYLINTARGALIDTGALVSALESGHLSGAALDVLEGEQGIFYTDQRHAPPRNEMLLRLQQLPNVIISPHIAYYTGQALRDMVENSILNCLKFERRAQHG